MVIEGNAQGLLDIAVTALSLAGPGASWASAELHEWGAGLEEGSLLLAIGRVGPAEGEPTPWTLEFDGAAGWRSLDFSGLGVRLGVEDAAVRGGADALVAFGELLVLLALGELGGEAVLGSGDFAEGSCGLRVREVLSSAAPGPYPAVWSVRAQEPLDDGHPADYAVGGDGRSLLSVRAVRALEGVLEGCVLEGPDSAGTWVLAEVPELDCLRDVAGGEQEVACAALQQSVGLFRIRGAGEGLYANDFLVHRAMETRLLGFVFSASWTSGEDPYPDILTCPARKPSDLVPQPSIVEDCGWAGV